MISKEECSFCGLSNNSERNYEILLTVYGGMKVEYTNTLLFIPERKPQASFIHRELKPNGIYILHSGIVAALI